MKKRLALTALILPIGALVATPFAAQAALGASHSKTNGAAILHSAKPTVGVGTPAVKPPHPPHPPHPPFPPTPPYYGPPFPWPHGH